MEKKNEKNEILEFQQPSLLATLKDVFVEWCLSSTAHAIPNIFRTGNALLKIIWTLCLLASTSYCIYSMIVSLQLYLSYPTFFTTEIVQEIPAEFPAVTVCNIKTINKTAATSYFLQAQFDQYIVNPNLSKSTFSYILKQQYFQRTVLSNDNLISDSQKKAFGFQLKEMMISCYFNYLDCDYTDFKYFYDPMFGNCYTFNSGIGDNGTKVDVKKVSVNGAYYGLIMEFFLGNTERDTMFEYNDGVILSIHSQSSPPFMDNKLMAPANADTDVVLSRNFLKKLESPYGNCLNDISASSSFTSYYFDYIVKKMNATYTQRYCFNLCLQKQILDTCGCANTFLPTFGANTSFCIAEHQTNCVYYLVNTFGDNQANTECKQSCPFECNTLDYELATFRAFYPTKFYQQILADYSLIKYSNVSYENIPQAVAKVNVYYKSMEYKQTTEMVAITTEAFFSNMGGTLGLYIGISLLSLVEMVELAINIIMAFLNFSKAKKQVKSSNMEKNETMKKRQK